jgi:ribonuclease HI
MSKYYAVRVGKKPGIYRSWPETQKQVVGFSGAVYKSFTTEREAHEFLTLPSAIDDIDERDFEVVAYCDGSSYQGLGGYGYLTIINGQIKKYCGPIYNSTNNIAELTAVKRCLRKLRNYERILIWTDSQYTINSLTVWIGDWNKNNWQTKHVPVENKELIQEIDIMLEERPGVVFRWVRGHAGQKYNEIVDKLANKGRLQANQ